VYGKVLTESRGKVDNEKPYYVQKFVHNDVLELV
jgi:hypothetical protein